MSEAVKLEKPVGMDRFAASLERKEPLAAAALVCATHAARARPPFALTDYFLRRISSPSGASEISHIPNFDFVAIALN